MAGFDCERRRFLISTLKAAAGVAILDAASSSPAIPEQTPAIIDAHVHFYDPTRPQGVPWPPPADKLLHRPTLPKNYSALPMPFPVTGVIAVEASPWLEDNQWLLDLAARQPLIVGVVGNLPVGTKVFAGQLKRFASNPLFRGIRIRDRNLDGTLDDPDFVNDLKFLCEKDLSLDLAGGAEILPFADRLAEKLPQLRIIIDHLAGVKANGKLVSTDWAQQMRRLSKRQNVFCKLSGLVEGAQRLAGSVPGDVEFYRPVLDAMREFFGAERLIYASNWPVSGEYAPLNTVFDIVWKYFQSRGRSADEQVLSQSAKAAYRWVRRG